VLGAIGVSVSEAQAGGFQLQEQSTYFQGTSFAGAAAGGPVSSMFWNPATLTLQGAGLTSETDATVIFPKSFITPSAASIAGINITGLGPSGDIGRDAFLPASYYSYGLTDRIVLGLGVNAPFGLVTQSSPIWAGMFYGTKSEVKTYNANPAVAVKITDWLSVGAGAQVEYIKVKLDSAFPGSGLALALPNLLQISGDSWDFGWTAGVTVTPTPWTTVGLGYRSRIDHSLQGDIFRPAFVTGVPIGPIVVPVLFPTAVTVFEATVPLPDIATLSIRQKVSDAFTLLGTVEWTNWSRLGTIPVTSNPAGIVGIPTALAFGWRDGWLFSGGAEYQWLPSLALRAGIAFERSPVSDDVRGVRLPDNDRVWLSAGATYNWSDRLAVEIGYSHLFVKDAPITITPGNPVFTPALGTFVGSSSDQIDIISVGLRYRWAPPPAPPPIVTKG
jgi:long-chain fatty acid transport protein